MGCNFNAAEDDEDIEVGAADCKITGCVFSSGSPRNIQILSGADNGVVAGCVFTSFATDAISNEGNGWVVGGNRNCKVTEVGAANANDYSEIDLLTSTITGSSSIINGQNTQLISAGPVTLLANAKTTLLNPTAGGFTLNLPAAAAARYLIFRFKHIGTANTVTIDADGAETIDGALTKELAAQFASLMIQSDGTTWHILQDSTGGGGTQVDLQNVFVYSLMNSLM
jgi:hypothetical protein